MSPRGRAASVLLRGREATRACALLARALVGHELEMSDPEQPLSCAGAARMRHWVEQRAQLSEVDVLKACAAARAASGASAVSPPR